MYAIQFIGYLSGFIIAVSLVPQVIKAYKTKSTTDISLLWNSIFLIGLLLFFVYGIGLGEMPIIVMNGIETLLAVLLLVAKLIYK
ncbi:MAG: PQ-loop domain-containing transporter [bacterium]